MFSPVKIVLTEGLRVMICCHTAGLSWTVFGSGVQILVLNQLESRHYTACIQLKDKMESCLIVRLPNVNDGSIYMGVIIFTAVGLRSIWVAGF